MTVCVGTFSMSYLCVCKGTTITAQLLFGSSLEV